jgi:midasin
MNPPDIGKKDLPPSLRNRFTEFYIDELEDKDDLKILISSYLVKFPNHQEFIDDIVNFYLQVKQQVNKSLAGKNKREEEHYSKY